VRFRYESWVRLVSRRARPRVDLAPPAHSDGVMALLVDTLAELDEGPAAWDPDGPRAGG
jgi:hypothetical protein